MDEMSGVGLLSPLSSLLFSAAPCSLPLPMPPLTRVAPLPTFRAPHSREKTRVVVPRRVAKGHTGYLTFATVLHPEALSGGSEGQARAAAALKEAAAEASGEAAAAEDTGEAAAPAADAET